MKNNFTNFQNSPCIYGDQNDLDRTGLPLSCRAVKGAGAPRPKITAHRTRTVMSSLPGCIT